MRKYAIKLTHGDTVRILQVFDDKPAAMAAGTEYRKTISRDAGLLACIEADFDENNQMIGTGYKLHDVIL